MPNTQPPPPDPMAPPANLPTTPPKMAYDPRLAQVQQIPQQQPQQPLYNQPYVSAPAMDPSAMAAYTTSTMPPVNPYGPPPV